MTSKTLTIMKNWKIIFKYGLYITCLIGFFKLRHIVSKTENENYAKYLADLTETEIKKEEEEEEKYL